MMRRLLGGLFVATLMPVMAIADGPIASSSFVGAENPLSENGAWAALTSLAPNGSRFQKNNGAYPNQPYYPNHAGARTTAVLPSDHYSEIVVGHVDATSDDVGPIVRVQVSGPSIDSHYLWWATLQGGPNSLYRIDANGAAYTATPVLPTSAVVDGDRLRLIARGPVIYGIKNGVRDFIYNTGPDTTKYSTGTAGMLAFAGDGTVTNAKIASWSAGAAPVSSGTWASSTFTGIENPLDEADTWYPLPGYSGFRKAGAFAIGRDSAHNATGVWSITPPAKQYSEVTLGAVASGGGGPIVRIDRNNAGQTGWLLFLYATNPNLSGIYKMNPDGSFTAVKLFTATIVSGDKWRLTADGNTLEVFRNGVSQFSYTTDGSYPTGDVGMETYTQTFTFTGWAGGDPAGPSPAPTITGFTPTSGSVGTGVAISGTNFTGATAVAFNGVNAAFTVSSATAIQTTVPAGATTGPLSVTTPGGTATSVGSFTVQPAATLSSLSLSPASVPGGSSSTGTVTLSGPAPSGGALVSLSSDNTLVATVPSSVTVPSGATTATFTVNTSAVGTSTSVTISASYNGVTRTASLAVTPVITLSSLSLSPASMTGGSPSTGTVTLSGPAPSGGALVSLSRDNTLVTTVPSSVTVPSGATTATFTVSTSAVAVSTSVTISASYGGGTQTASITILPPILSSLTLNPSSVLGGPLGTSTGTVTLNGPAPDGGALVTLSSSNTGAATVPASVTVAAGATTATFTVNTSVVLFSTTVTISGSYNATQSAQLTVRAAVPLL